jgi:hypothetical protein
MLRNMYQPDIQGKGRPYYIDGYYDTAEEAFEELRKLEDEPYYTSNGEAGRPEYIVIDEDESIDFEVDFSGSDCDCGECVACQSHITETIRKVYRNNAIKE